MLSAGKNAAGRLRSLHEAPVMCRLREGRESLKAAPLEILEVVPDRTCSAAAVGEIRRQVFAVRSVVKTRRSGKLCLQSAIGSPGRFRPLMSRNSVTDVLSPNVCRMGGIDFFPQLLWSSRRPDTVDFADPPRSRTAGRSDTIVRLRARGSVPRFRLAESVFRVSDRRRRPPVGR